MAVETLDPSAAMFAGGIIAFLMAFLVIFLVIMIIIYVFMGLALMAVAKRTNTENAWLAWVPIGNIVLMAKIAKMHWWPVLLLIGALIPYIGILFSLAFMVFSIIWQWKICEARNKPGWWALLLVIPLVNIVWMFVMWGILAWGKD